MCYHQIVERWFTGRSLLSARETTFSVTFSCGIATFSENDSANDLVERVDKALYQAKSKGRNRVLLSGA